MRFSIRKKWWLLLAVPAALVGVFCLVNALRPDRYEVSRSARIDAPASSVFAQVNDLAAWGAWSPWTKLDPNAKTTLTTPAAGKGATLAWNGNDQVDEGRMAIVESRPDERVTLEQEFVRPMPGKAIFTFDLAPQGGGTQVTWTIRGENGFLGKAICLVMDMDATLGGAFEKGLAGLKASVEGKKAAPAEEKSPVDVGKTAS